ncbi:MAG: hypothetical protein ACTSU7_09320 [Candidatus Heimdallarchaeaceae archaeon]
MPKGYNTFWISTDDEGNGIELHTHDGWFLTSADIYINPHTSLAIAEYVAPTGRKECSHFTCEDFDSISIQQIKEPTND